MSTAGHDDVRAAAALVAIAAARDRGRHLRAVVLDLDLDPDPGHLAAIAHVLATWLAEVLRETGIEPKAFARQVITDSIGAEAAEGTP